MPLKGSLGTLTVPLLVWYCLWCPPCTGCLCNALHERRKDLKSKVFGQLRPSPLPHSWLQSSLSCWASLLCLIHPCFFLCRDINEECWKLETLKICTASRLFVFPLKNCTYEQHHNNMWMTWNGFPIKNCTWKKGYQTCGRHQPEVWLLYPCTLKTQSKRFLKPEKYLFQ